MYNQGIEFNVQADKVRDRQIEEWVSEINVR